MRGAVKNWSLFGAANKFAGESKYRRTCASGHNSSAKKVLRLCVHLAPSPPYIYLFSRTCYLHGHETCFFCCVRPSPSSHAPHLIKLQHTQRRIVMRNISRGARAVRSLCHHTFQTKKCHGHIRIFIRSSGFINFLLPLLMFSCQCVNRVKYPFQKNRLACLGNK